MTCTVYLRTLRRHRDSPPYGTLTCHKANHVGQSTLKKQTDAGVAFLRNRLRHVSSSRPKQNTLSDTLVYVHVQIRNDEQDMLLRGSPKVQSIQLVYSIVCWLLDSTMVKAVLSSYLPEGPPALRVSSATIST